MKGIVLAGGTGTRLYPNTKIITKQLLPIYDKPMIYYPITTLILAQIRDIAIITTPNDAHLYHDLLGDGKQWGVNFTYVTQPRPEGIAQAFIVAEEFIGDDDVCLILGDNILYGDRLGNLLKKAGDNLNGATVFSYYVPDPERYGVVELDKDEKPLQIVEKPQQFISNHALIGLYFYDNQVIKIAKNLKPSPRGELEITDVSKVYLDQQQLHVESLGRGIAWLDTGTHASMLDAANFIEVLEKRTSLKIGCPEEAAWRNGYIDNDALIQLAEPAIKSGYGKYLLSLLEREAS